jgi:hypothetical protein
VTHEHLVTEAKRAIDAVHSDTSVPRRRTLDSLNALSDHIDPLAEALEADLVGDARYTLGCGGDLEAEELTPDA